MEEILLNFFIYSVGQSYKMYNSVFSSFTERQVFILAQIATRITEEEKQKIEKFAKEHDLTLSQILRKAIKEFMEKEQSK